MEVESAAWLDPEARAVAEVLLVLVLPAAAGAPSAREAGVLPALLERARTAERRRLYRQGLAGFDRLARRRSGRRFVELPADQARALVARADAVAARLQWRRSASFPARLRRRAALLYYHPRGPGGRHGLGEAARLFPVLCADAFAAYYATPRVWRWLGYDGPPMPEGYPSLTAARGEP